MVTIKDVAQKAGVNASTVSRVLKDSSSISKKTKDRVREAMRSLGYVPNLAAQMLASGLTQCIGVVLPPLNTTGRIIEPFFMEILTIINNTATQYGFTVSIATSDTIEGLTEQVKLMYKQKRVDGFLILYSQEDDPVRDYLLTYNIPCVVIGTPNITHKNLICVDNDNQQMGTSAVDHLYKKGHKNILFITDDTSSKVFTERYHGYQTGIKSYNLPTQTLIVFNYKDETTSHELVDTIKNRNITAIIVIGDLLSVRLIHFLSSFNLQIPKDLSLISFNNSFFSKMLHPYLTTFDINVKSLGQTSLKLLIDAIKKENKKNTRLLVPFIIKERESTQSLNSSI